MNGFSHDGQEPQGLVRWWRIRGPCKGIQMHNVPGWLIN